MRPNDREVFAACAQDLGLWILVRRTNAESLKYIGRPGYAPKPIDCKAKTADRDIPRPGGRGVYHLAGLVADPTLVPAAFGPEKLQKALGIWKDFKLHHIDVQRGPHRYGVVADQRLKHYGAVTLDGDLIHGDYDLYDVVDHAQPTRNLALVTELHGQPHMRGPNLYKVMEYINGQIGSDVVQHGGEYQYARHTRQVIDVFGPNGEEQTLTSLAAIERFYKTEFGGRKSTQNAPWRSKKGAGGGTPVPNNVIPFPG